jgi:hypothetical protein
MKLPGKKHAPEQPTSTPAAAADVEPVAQAATWTNGSRLGSKGISFLIVAALVCGPVGLVLAATSGGSSSAAPQEAKTEQVSPLQQSAGSFASGYVGAWLGATQDDSAALGTYTDTNVQQLAKTGFEYRNVAVASIVNDENAQLSRGCQRRHRRRGQGRPVAPSLLPGRRLGRRLQARRCRVARPGRRPRRRHGRTSPQLRRLDLLELRGGQDRDRVPRGLPHRPRSDRALHGPVDVDPGDLTGAVSSIDGETAPAEQPEDGATVKVYATVVAANSVGQQATSTYTLDLRARADRWEVAALGTPPALSDQTATSATTPTPSPTGDSPQKGN